MPPKVKRLTIREMMDELQRNSPLVRDALNLYGLPKPIQRITHNNLLCCAIKKNREDLVRIMISKGCSVEGGVYDSLPLHIAVENGNLNIVRIILLAANTRASTMLNKTKNGESPLHYAVKNLNKAMIKLLIDHGADWRVPSNSGKTVLHLAVEKLRTTSFQEVKEVMEIFLQKQMNVDSQSSTGQTPLHYAIIEQSKEMVEFLLTHNASLHVVDKMCNSALHILFSPTEYSNYHHYRYNLYSSSQGQVIKMEFVEWLISIGADIDLQNFKGQTPLYLAIRSKQKQGIHTLLKHSKNFDCVDNEENQTVLHLLLKVFKEEFQEVLQIFDIILEKKDENIKQKVCKAINILNKQGDSPIHLALRQKHTKLALKLLPYFTDITICDSTGLNLFHTALNNYLTLNSLDPEVNIEIIKALLLRGVDVNQELKNKNNETPLQLAAKYKNKEIALLLLKHGADVSVCGHNNMNLLHYLGLEQVNVDKTVQREMVNLFIEKGCDINAKTKDGKTPLCFAIKAKCDGVAETLFEMLTSCTDVSKEDLCCVLATAAENNCEGLIQPLLKHGADVNTRFAKGKTALHIATRHKKENKTIKTLLAHSADYEICDEDGKTPLHYACWYESAESIDNLLEYGASINAIDELSKVPKDYICGIDENIGKKLLYYITKLEVADLFVNDRNKELIEKNKSNEELNLFYTSCLEEVERLKDHIVHNNVSIYDVLHMKKDQLPTYEIKSSLNKILCSLNLKEKFPIYRDMILASHRKGVFRSNLLKSALYSLIEITKTDMPVDCLENILKFLTNSELRLLIDSEISFTRKRKSPTESHCQPAIISAKKQKRE